MFVLAIDTSSAAITCGIVEVGTQLELRAERVVLNPRGHGELLAPGIEACLAETWLRPHQLGAVVAGVGPGPFTGLRVGLVTAAVMGDTLSIPTYGVCSLDAIGTTLPGHALVLSDARRREVYWARYRDGVREGNIERARTLDPLQAGLLTVAITVVSVAIEFVLGMALALVMHRTIFGKGLVRTAILVPYGIVTVAASYSWYYAWTPGTGYLANLLPTGSAPLTEQIPSLAVVVLAEVWKTTPFMALLLLAGLALVPQDLLNAAQVDGAGGWQRLVRIILPLIKPAILVALLFRTLDAFRIFDNIYVLTGGSNDTGSVSILGYDNLFKAFNLGLGSAISVLIFLCVAIIAFIYIKLFGASAPGSPSKTTALIVVEPTSSPIRMTCASMCPFQHHGN